MLRPANWVKIMALPSKPLYLAAHALPPEYKDNADGYIDAVCEWMPILHAEGLIDAVEDAFCENIAFTLLSPVIINRDPTRLANQTPCRTAQQYGW